MRPPPEILKPLDARPARTRPFVAVASTQLRRNDKLAFIASLISGLIIIAMLAGILQQLVVLSIPAMQRFGFGFLTGTVWDPVHQNFGALPFIYGTLVSSAIALLIATPFGIGTALFLTELAPRRLRSIIAFVVDMLAAIPSVVYGLWGIFVLAPFVQSTLAPLLEQYLGFLPMFRGPNVGVSMITAGLILAIMVVPYITAIAREVLMTTPADLKAASLALGATKWETIWKVVLPYSRVGIGAGVVLALGRALGETMAVTMVIGNTPEISASILRPADSMASVIANNFREADTAIYLSALVAVGLVLFIVALFINLAARVLLWKMRGPARHA
jgi:phosphate transport system permease protein